MLNKWTGIGNVGKTPEIKHLDNLSIANFSLATTESYKTKAGEKKKDTSWHNITIFGNLVKVVESYVKSGDKLYIEGKIKYESYEKDGQTKYITKIICTHLQMLGSKGDVKPEDKAPVKNETPNFEDFSDENDLPF